MMLYRLVMLAINSGLVTMIAALLTLITVSSIPQTFKSIVQSLHIASRSTQDIRFYSLPPSDRLSLHQLSPRKYEYSGVCS
jgi:hypothetical protein